MKKNRKCKLRKALIFFLFCIICPEVFATIFSVIPTDRSQQYLGTIFGGSVGAVSLPTTVNNPTLSKMFQEFNYIILTVGAAVLSFLGVSSVINTAREGEALGKKISMWVPIRAFTGMLLMVPGPSSGYSFVQMTVMWIVLNGIGAANQVWNVVLNQLSLGVSVASSVNIQMQPSNLNSLTENVMRASTCMYVINNYMPELTDTPGPIQNYGPVRILTMQNPIQQTPSTDTPTQLTQTAIIKVGLNNAPAPYDTLCGYFTVTSILNSGSPINTFNYATLTRRLQIKTAGLTGMFNAVDTITQLLANPAISNVQISTFDKGYVYASGEAYISQITQLATGIQLAPNDTGHSWEQQAPTNTLSTNYQALESYGWIQAGSYYYTMVKASGAHLDPETIFGQAILPQAAGVPFTTTLGSNGMPAVGSGWITNNNTYTTGVTSLLSGGAPYYETTTLNKALSNSDVYYNGDQNTPAPPNQGITTNNASTGNSFMDAIVQGIASAIRNPILNYLQDLAGGNGTDPLISLGRFGTALMLAGEISVFAALITSIAISLAASSVSCMSPFAWGVNLLLVQLMPLIYGIAVMLWTGGATLGVYIPMIPYLIFTTSAFGWMIAVVEAIVGAPIIALGLTHPSDGELGKATEGLIIVANIFLRPTLMIFGFVIGASLMRAGLALINFGFIPALNEGTSATLFSIIAVLAMYIFLVMTLINKSFALIYMLPNKILRWMGGRSEEFDPSDMTNQAKSGFESGAGKAQGMQEAGLKAAGDKSKGATDQRNKSLENPGGQGGGQLPSPGGAGGAGGTPG